MSSSLLMDFQQHSNDLLPQHTEEITTSLAGCDFNAGGIALTCTFDGKCVNYSYFRKIQSGP